MNANNIRASNRFTARSNMSVDRLYIYIAGGLGTPEVRAGIQGDSNGVPNGTYLSAPVTFDQVWIGGGSWIPIILSSTVNLISGTVYHIVVEALSTDTGDYLVWEQGSVPPTQLYPLGQQVDPNMGIVQDFGGGWTAIAGFQPIFALLKGCCQVLDGNPYITETDVSISQSLINQLVAERFIVNGLAVTVKSVGAYVKETGLPTVNLLWQIQSLNSGTTLTSGTLAVPGQLTTSYSWIDTSILSTALPSGIYRFILYSPGSNCPNCYQWSLAGTNSNGFPPFSSITYDKDHSFGESSNFSSWVSFGSYGDNDFGFRMLLDNNGTPTPVPTSTPAGVTFIGNQSVFVNRNELVLNDPSVRGSLRFTARSNMTVGAFDLYSDGLQPGITFRYGIQGDSSGVPNGIYLSAPTTLTNGSIISGSSWMTYLLTTPLSLTAGTVYHLVVEVVSANSGGYFIWDQFSLPAMGLYPLGQQTDPNMGIAQDLGSGWSTIGGGQPLFVLKDASFKPLDGNPYSLEIDEDIQGGSQKAEEFVISGIPVTVKTVGAFVKEVGSPGGNLNWNIQNVTFGVTLGSGTLATPAQVGTNYNWVEANNPSMVLQGGIYQFVLNSPGSSLGNDYQWSLAGSSTLCCTGNYTNITYGKDSAFGMNSSNGGLGWVNLTFPYDDDFGFRMQMDNSATPTPIPTATPNGAFVIGNQSVVNTNNILVMNSAGIRGSLRFTARSSAIVNKIDLNFDFICAPHLRIGIQGDLAGVPNGIYLSAPTTFVVGGYGWTSTIALSPAVNINSGTVYHIVLETVSADSADYALWRQGSSPTTKLYPLGQTADPNLGIAQDLGDGTWRSIPGFEPIFALWTGGSTPSDGNPYALEVDQNMAGVTQQAERFTSNNADIINSIGAYVKKVGTPADNLTWEIRTLAGALISSGILATPAQVGAAYQWVETSIAPLILPTGTLRFILNSTGSSIGNDYQWGLAGSQTVGSPLYGTITYDGTNSFGDFSTNSGSSWASYTNNPYDNDFGFRFYTNGSTPTGTPTGSATPTITPTPTYTLTPTLTPTITLTFTKTPTATPTVGGYCLVAEWGTLGSGIGQFTNPQGIATDVAGNIYVADFGNNRVETFDNNGNYLGQLGGYGSGNGQFSGPMGIVSDASRNFFVSDYYNARIEKFDVGGSYVSQWGGIGSGNGQFSAPLGVAVDGTGNVYVADWNNNRVQKFGNFGNYLTQWGGVYGNGNGQFEQPNSLAVDSSGNVFVTDSNTNRVQKFDSNGNYLSKWGSSGIGPGQFSGLRGVAVDSIGNVYVVDSNQIQKFDNNGNYLAQIGTPGASLALDPAGNLFVVVLNQVQKYKLCNPPLTFTPTPTGSPTVSETFTPMNTFTKIPTDTTTASPTPTPSNSPTNTSTNTSTWTPTNTPTITATWSPTNSPTITPTDTSTDSPTITPTPIPTDTATVSPTDSPTSTPSATPTETPTQTSTNTVTITATFTPTNTLNISPTPTFTPTPISAAFNVILFPNPATGPTVTLRVSLPVPADVKLKIYTVAGNKVQEENFPGVDAGVNDLQIALSDKWGSPLANGLYFVQVQAKDNKTIFKLIVAR